jgi:hypothetical protein
MQDLSYLFAYMTVCLSLSVCLSVSQSVFLFIRTCQLVELWTTFRDTLYDDFFIITNLIHKFLVYSHKLHKIKLIYMFRAQSAYHQEVNDANCAYAASGIVTL